MIHKDGIDVECPCDGGLFFFKRDNLHREDGPAAIKANGEYIFLLDGIQYSEIEYNKRLRMKAFW